MNAKQILVCLGIAIMGLVPFIVLYSVLVVGNQAFWFMAMGYALHFGLAIAGISGAVIVHNQRTDRIRTSLNAEDAAIMIEEYLKKIGYAVGSTDQKVNVLLDRSRTVKIIVSQTSNGSELLVYPSLTRDGLGSMFSYCVILPFCGIIGLWMSYRSARLTADFSANVLRPTMAYLDERERSKGKGSEQQEIRSVITNTLKKANRLATEAFMALNASYSDSKWYVSLAGFISYAALVFYLILNRDLNAAWPAHYTTFLEFMLVAIIVLVTLSLIWLRLRYRSESGEVNKKIGELQAAISREEGKVPTADGDEAALETLLKVCPNLPTWTRYRTRNFYMRNPNIATVIGWSLFVLIFSFGAFTSVNLVLPFISILLGTSVVIYVVTKLRNLRSDRITLEQWRSRIGTLKAELESKLQEL